MKIIWKYKDTYSLFIIVILPLLLLVKHFACVTTAGFCKYFNTALISMRLYFANIAEVVQ